MQADLVVFKYAVCVCHKDIFSRDEGPFILYPVACLFIRSINHLWALLWEDLLLSLNYRNETGLAQWCN